MFEMALGEFGFRMGYGAAIAVVEDLVVHAAGDAVAQGAVDRAVDGVVGPAVGVVVVEQGMRGLADHLLLAPAQDLLRGRVGEDDPALEVDALDALAHGIEDVLGELAQFGEPILRRPPLGHVAGDAEHRADLAIRVAQRRRVRLHPAQGACEPDDAESQLRLTREYFDALVAGVAWDAPAAA